MSIAENVKNYLEKIRSGNCFGEKITLVAATKTRTADEINEAIEAGITDIGENKVQEFRDKFDLVHGANRHFIGHLQTNKVKYLIGKTYLYHSVDRDELAEEIAVRSRRAGIVSDILIQVNIGNEESKGGYALSVEDGSSDLRWFKETLYVDGVAMANAHYSYEGLPFVGTYFSADLIEARITPYQNLEILRQSKTGYRYWETFATRITAFNEETGAYTLFFNSEDYDGNLTPHELTVNLNSDGVYQFSFDDQTFTWKSAEIDYSSRN